MNILIYYILSDIAIPYIFNPVLTFPMLFIVAGIEVFYVYKILGGTFSKAGLVCLKANFYTTIVGYLFIGLFSMIVVSVIFSILRPSPAVVEHLRIFTFLLYGVQPYSPPQYCFIAEAFMLIPSYYLSVYLEYQVLKKSYLYVDSKTILKTAIWMNRTSYVFLMLIILVYYLCAEYWSK